ncbi:hypothetical protein ABW19_dt0200210 [Dactylella cylindrospora]|nr:hypothetical protein ABW19_dt0200210 [Dactylella cylindrospora]
MTSFVTTATTMFSRFPLRHSKQKEPTIGFPVLVDSSRQDVLLLSGENLEKTLPPLPPQHESSGFATLRYTTTPNFNSSPIAPSTNTPPTFHSIPRQNTSSLNQTLGQAKKNVFSRKPVNSAPPASLGAKSIDLLHAAQVRRGSTPEELERQLASPSPEAVEPKSDIPPPAPEKAPRLRDSILPPMKPMDRSFLKSLDSDSEDEEDAVPKPDPTKSTASRLPLPQVRSNYEPQPLRVKGVSSSSSGPGVKTTKRKSPPPSLSPTGAPMIDIPKPLTPILQETGDEASVLLSLVSEYESGNSSPQEPKGGEAYIALLERQRDQLIARQKRTMGMIRDIEQCLPPNPSTHNYTQRAQLKAELRNLQSEYDGLSRDLYEKGLMLHRAWKRRDADLGLEPPAVLWVRRVGGNEA